ncbi:MAG TPA: chemotaxis protein CheW [Candidatus Acidoferrum sp.]|nr:chemotaxis protein CheW [Candidatus Acidoferrum sp.]
MLFLLFQVGENRYALETSRVVEVVPLVELKPLPQAPEGVAGVFDYRGRPIPAVDLASLMLGRPARELLSTRIVVVNYPDDFGSNHFLGLVAERVTSTLRKDARDFVDPGGHPGLSPQLGPILMEDGTAIQWVHERRWLPQRVSELLTSDLSPAGHEPR